MRSAGVDGGDCRRRARASIAALVMLVASGCAEPEPTPEGVQTGPAARPNFEVRLDSESSDPAEFQVVEDDDGIRVNTGPAGIVYRDTDVVVSGDMLVQATFRQYDAPVGYREAFGLFVGGRDLTGSEQEYTYLLVRTTGDVLVKRRIGDITETLLDWTAHPAVRTVDAEGDQPANTLSVDVFDGVTHFMVNGDIVHSIPASAARPYGVAGVRVNHRLDVRIDGWLLRETSDAS